MVRSLSCVAAIAAFLPLAAVGTELVPPKFDKKDTTKTSTTWTGPKTLNRAGVREAFFVAREADGTPGPRIYDLKFKVTEERSATAGSTVVGTIGFGYSNASSTWNHPPARRLILTGYVGGDPIELATFDLPSWRCWYGKRGEKVAKGTEKWEKPFPLPAEAIAVDRIDVTVSHVADAGRCTGGGVPTPAMPRDR